LAISGAPVFGWAKPVMVNPNNFKRPSVDNFIVALAGPVANILAAILCAVLIRFTTTSGTLGTLLFYLLEINVTLAVFNLLPIPPLDGSKVWYLFLSYESAYTLERFGPLILIAVIFFSASSNNFLMNAIMTISQFIVSRIS
jgi:Zn-dependent protease